MARFELKLPKMGESVAEATITNWLKQVGDRIEIDEAVLEIATDKVDSEVPSEVAGILTEQLFQKDDLVQVGQTIAIIETEGGAVAATTVAAAPAVQEVPAPIAAIADVAKTVEAAKDYVAAPTPAAPAMTAQDYHHSEKFFSPLVRNIAKEE
ncbi:biotin/lipoyl-containing protein, partial [Flavobacterium sp.]|uniref:biotin/lipoyl-containing protein n=1 Tax=Flavobacterium sp. TaxID=239 RepID=UPI00286CF8E3